MSFSIDANDYVAYLKNVAGIIAQNKEYISGLDAATGDGDHWANLTVGFEALLAAADDLERLNMGDFLKRIGMLMMNGIGGSSGVLYGGAYMAAGKAMAGKSALDAADLAQVYAAMCQDMCARGQSEPGFKTMIDALHPAVQAFEQGLAQGLKDRELLASVKQAASAGAESTRQMKAVRGRAYYQAEKGVGHLDPGAVTMSYQIGAFMDYIIAHKL